MPPSFTPWPDRLGTSERPPSECTPGMLQWTAGSAASVIHPAASVLARAASASEVAERPELPLDAIRMRVARGLEEPVDGEVR